MACRAALASTVPDSGAPSLTHTSGSQPGVCLGRLVTDLLQEVGGSSEVSVEDGSSRLSPAGEGVNFQDCLGI